MLVRASKIVAVSVMTLAVAAISLPSVALSAIAPTVDVLAPIAQGLRAPVKMVLDASGNAYVADQRAGGVVKFNAFGEQVALIGTSSAPTGLAFALDGTLLVSQTTYVARYNVSSGLEVGRFVGGQLQSASGVVVDDVTGYVYVADGAAKQIVVFNSAGEYVGVFGKGLLVSPVGVAFEKISRQVVVADAFGNKIQFFDVDGNLVKSLSKKIGNSSSITGVGYGPLQFVNPIAVAFEYSKSPVALSRMYVLDAYQGMAQVIDPNGGVYLKDIGGAGAAAGQLMVPSDVLFDAVNSRLMVVNGFGNIAVFGIDGGKSPVAVAPSFTVDQLPSDVAVGSVTVSGTVSSGVAVQVVAGGASVGAVVYDASATKWSAVVTGLNYGVNAITVSAKDSAPVVVSVNYLAPAPSVTVATVPAITNVNKIKLSGMVDAGSVVSVLNQASSQSGVATVVGGAWSYDAALAEGQNIFNIVAQKAGSVKASAVASIALDTVAPVLAVSALADKSNASDSVQNISGQVSDANSVVVSVNGIPVSLSGNKFSLPIVLNAGANQVEVVATDAAGNSVSDARVITFVPGPVVAIDSPKDNSVTSSSAATVSGTAHNAVAVTVNGAPVNLLGEAWSVNVDLVAGQNTIDVVAKDVDNILSSVKRTIIFDNNAPVLSIGSPAQDLATKEPGMQIAGVVADSDSSIVSLSYKFKDKVFELPVDKVYSFNVEFGTEGVFPVEVVAKDSAGNVSSVTRNIVFDVTPPQFTMNQANGVMPTQLKGTVEPGSTVVVRDGSAQIGVVSIQNGEWNANLSGVNYIPENLIAVATDPAGNSTSKVLSYSFPDGTLNGDGRATVKDAMQAIKLVVNQGTPSALELAHYDIGPLVSGKPNPNGKIEIVDAILILRRALGLKSW